MHKSWQLAINIFGILTCSIFVFPSSFAQDKLPMSGQPASSPSAGATPDHVKHHPAGASPVAAPAAGMMDDMGSMMAPAPVANPNTTTILPIPQNSLDDQLRIEQLANTRINDGTAVMTQGIGALSQAKQRNDLTEMSRASAQIRNGLFQVESGLAAHRAVAEGTAPQDVSITWFKQQMNLAPTEQAQDIFGVSWFHFFVMVALSIFAIAMILMYFFKMRRAAEVLGRVPKPAAPAEEIQVDRAPVSEVPPQESDATTASPTTEA